WYDDGDAATNAPRSSVWARAAVGISAAPSVGVLVWSVMRPLSVEARGVRSARLPPPSSQQPDRRVRMERMTGATYPLRFRSAEARGTRIGRPLRRFGRVRGVDEVLLDRIGRAFGERDELAASLAAALRRPPGAEGRVTRAQL